MDDDPIGPYVRAAVEGDQAAWNIIVERYGRLVWYVVRGVRMDRDLAADAWQSTWVLLVQHLADLRDPERIGAWLATTARREALRLVRESARETDLDDDMIELPSDEPEIDAGLLSAERVELVRGCLEECPAQCRSLLRLLVVDPPMSYAQIGKTLDMKVGSIGPTRQRCLAHLRRRLRAAGMDVY